MDILLQVSNGSIYKSGGGVLLLQGTNDFSQAVESCRPERCNWETATQWVRPVQTSTAAGALDLNGFSVASGAMNVSGSGVGGSGAVINTGSTNSSWGWQCHADGKHHHRQRADHVDRWRFSGPFGLTKIGYGTLNMSGSVSFTGGLTVNSGSVVLTGTNTFTGGVTLSGGGLTVGSDAALGNMSNGVTLASGGVLIVGTSFSTARTFSAAGGTLAVSSGQNLTITGPGGLTGSGTMNIAGPGTAILQVANSLTGPLVVTGGVVDVAGVSGAFPSIPSVDVLTTGTFQLDSNSNNSNNRLTDAATVDSRWRYLCRDRQPYGSD